MFKILLLLLFLILIDNIVVETAPTTVDEDEIDIRVTLARLHQETDRIRRRLNPVPDAITFASNDVATRLKRYVQTESSEADSDTVYVNLNIESEEDLETKYVNLYIDTRHTSDVQSTDLNHISDYMETKFVYLDIDSVLNTRLFPSYRRFRRNRRMK